MSLLIYVTPVEALSILLIRIDRKKNQSNKRVDCFVTQALMITSPCSSDNNIKEVFFVIIYLYESLSHSILIRSECIYLFINYLVFQAHSKFTAK